MLVAVAAAAPALLLTPTVGSARGRPGPVTLRNRHLVVQAVESKPAANKLANTGDTTGATKCTGEEHAAMTSIGGDFASKYGEITGRGFTSLAERLRLGPDDVFVDCGSGLGLSVSQAAREFGVRRSYGVEFSTSRHDLAVERLAADASDDDTASRVRLLQGDCAEAALWAAEGELSTCTCVYACNLLFDAALNARIKRRVESCASIRCVAAFRKADWPEGLEGFAEPYEVRCDTSWSPIRPKLTWDATSGTWEAEGGSTVYVYERSDPSFLQRATSREVIVVVFVLTLARVLSQLVPVVGTLMASS